jgi:hypothetical protein
MQGAVSSAVSSQPAQDTDALDEPEEPGVVSRDDRNDVALALALAQAALSVEQVVDVSAGRYGTAVTYGPGQRVTGIVVRRPTPSATSAAPSFVVEAHIVVATAAVTVLAAPPLAALKTSREKGQRPQATSAHSASDTPRAPVLLRIADDTRRVLAATLRRLRPGETWEIDITIDDLRDTDARASSRVQ